MYIRFMNTRTKIVAVAVIAAPLVMGTSACGALGESNMHNVSTPGSSSDIRPNWHRIDSPPNYPTIVGSCVGPDGVYIDQDTSNSVDVVPNDPRCQ